MDPVTEAGSILRNRAHEARERIGDAVHHTREKVEGNVHEHPLQTVLLSVGAGLLIGVLLGLVARRRSD